MSWSSLTSDVISTLEGWPTPDLEQEHLLTRNQRLVADEGERALIKGVLPAHLTASLVVLDTDRTKVLLTHHKRADAWLQFGGHFEESDQTLEAAARREGSEESGLVLDGPLVPADLDAHLLVGAFGLCQEHLDVRYVTTVPGDAQPAVSDESNDVRWFPLDRVDEDLPHLKRLIERAVAALG